MTVTRLGRTPPILSTGTFSSSIGGSSGATSGQVPTATGSNGDIVWGENVARITSNTSNTLLGPYLSVLSGAGIFFAVSSNALTISSTVAGGGGDHADSDHDFVTVNEGGGELLSTVSSSGSTETIDLTDGNVHDITLTANCAITFASVTSGRARSFTLLLRQDGTGSRLATWPASVNWAGGSAPTLSTSPSAVDFFTFVTVNGGATWYGFEAGGDDSADDGYWETVTNGNAADPECVYADGDIVVAFVEN